MDTTPSREAPLARGEYIRRVALAIAIATLAFALAALIWVAARLLALVFTGLMVAALLRTASRWVGARLRIAPRRALLIVLAAILATIIAMGALLAPEIGGQLSTLSEQLPRSLSSLRDWLAQHRAGRWLLEHLGAMNDLAPQPARVLSGLTGVLSGTIGVVASVVIVIFVGAYVAADPHLYERGAVALVPPAGRARARQVIRKAYDALRSWLLGQLIIMAAVGVLTFIGLWAIGMDLAVSLAIIAALTDFIPYLGPYLAGVPIVLVAANSGTEMLLWAVGVLVVVQAIEGYLLTPLILQRTAYLPPALTIVAQVLLGVLLGPVGVIVAAPAAAVGLVVVRELYINDALGGAPSDAG